MLRSLYKFLISVLNITRFKFKELKYILLFIYYLFFDKLS
jgi:hypothetical protein